MMSCKFAAIESRLNEGDGRKKIDFDSFGRVLNRQAMIEEFDLDQDGEISEHEFIK